MESGQSSAGSQVGSPEADSMNPGLPCWWFDRSQNAGRQFLQLNPRILGCRPDSAIVSGLKGHTFIGTGRARDRGNIRDGSDAILGGRPEMVGTR